MTANLESEQVFKARCKAVGLSDVATGRLETSGWTTLAKFAYMSSYTPGSATDDAFVAALTRSFGGPPNDGEMSCLRRLFYEAFTLAAGYLKSTLENPDGAAPRKLAIQEKVFRMSQLKRKYSGIKIESELEPSDQLIDRFHQMAEDNRLCWVPWNECTARDHEVVGQKKKAIFSEDQSGALKITRVEHQAVTDTSTEYLLRLALQRRGLAMEVAGILSYDVHELWVAELFTSRMREPPPQYGRVSIDALESADKALFCRLSDVCRERIAADGVNMPVEAAFPAAMLHSTVTYRLMPLPLGSAGSGSGKWKWKGDGQDADTHEPEPKGKGKGKGKFNKWRQQQMASGKGNKSKGKEKGKGKGNVPKALIGLHTQDADGNRMCYNFNLPGGCEYEAGACPRGKHACMKPFCYLPHSQLEHPQ